MDDARRSLGAEGEARAAGFLVARGYTILARNARAGRVELDIVASRGGVVAFVEVKSRRGRGHGAPEEAVDRRKCARIVRGARAWLRATETRARRVRFDVIACEVSTDGAWVVRHLPGAFDGNDVD